MMTMLTAHTLEIDDVDFAVSEIMKQLNLDENLRAHSAGIVTCYSEFIDTGVLQALCEKLPFDVVGSTTLGNADNTERNQMMLSLTVLTSDDIKFAAVYSDSISGDQREPLTEVFEEGVSKLGEEPKMMFSFLPLLPNIGGDETIALMDEISGGVLSFGTVAVDHTADYHTSQTFMNGECSADRMAMLLVAGDINPMFLIASISEDKIIKQQAIITASKSNVLMEVNGMPVVKYMETLGLFKDGQVDGANSIPYIVDFGDGTPPLARAIYALTPEGYAVCGGVMPVNATLSVGSIDYADVMRTTEQTLRRALEQNKAQGLMMFSCISRFMALGMDSDAEMNLLQDVLQEGLPYQFSYSGGEICPVMGEDGKWHNRFHNDTFVACIF